MTLAKRQRRNASDSPPRKGVARLPKWMLPHWETKMYKALSIAWAALDSYAKHFVNESDAYEAKKAMRAIRRLGR